MKAKVVCNGSESKPFAVTNSTKQGCILALTLLSIVIAAMISDAERGSGFQGMNVHCHTDGSVYNFRRLKAKT